MFSWRRKLIKLDSNCRDPELQIFIPSNRKTSTLFYSIYCILLLYKSISSRFCLLENGNDFRNRFPEIQIRAHFSVRIFYTIIKSMDEEIQTQLTQVISFFGAGFLYFAFSFSISITLGVCIVIYLSIGESLDGNWIYVEVYRFHFLVLHSISVC